MIEKVNENIDKMDEIAYKNEVNAAKSIVFLGGVILQLYFTTSMIDRRS